jgi:DNA-binding response OmpR family regulator
MSGDKVFFRELNTLIIDDSDGMQRLLAEMLGGCVKGHITACRTVDKGLQELEREYFGLAVIDRELANEDGLEFVRRVRARRGLHQKLPVVALSVNSSREIVLETLLSGAHTLVRKPLSRHDLHLHVRRALSEERVFLPFAGHVIPLRRSIAWKLGRTPTPQAIMEALAASMTPPEDRVPLIDTTAATLVPASHAGANQDSFAFI